MTGEEGEETRTGKAIPTDDKSFSIFLLNAQSLRNKRLEVEAFLTDCTLSFDVLCFCEHFLDDSEGQSFSLGNYEVASAYSRGSTLRGGVMIMVRQGYNYRVCSEINDSSVASVCEVTAIEIMDFDLIVLALYRSPLTDFSDFLGVFDEVLRLISARRKRVLVGGDFNINFFTDDNRYKQLSDLLVSFDLRATLDSPTRGRNCLDNFLVNFEGDIRVETLDPGISDHKAIILEAHMMRYDVGQPPATSGGRVSHRCYSESGKVNFYRILQDMNFDFINAESINEGVKFDRLLTGLRRSIELAFPLKTFIKNNGKKIDWFSDELRGIREQVRILSEMLHRY